MNLSFHGAAGEVTGSCTLVDTGQEKFLVDCGLFQGGKYAQEENFAPWRFDPREIDFLILTHAHADHCGRLPKLYADGFRGKIYATPATRDLAGLIMLDSARIIREEAMHHGTEPLYAETDAQGVSSLFWPIDYHQRTKISSEVEINFLDAGHILGSASVECRVKQRTGEKKIVFSGDLGNPPVPLIRDTEFASGADVLIIESTYGGRIHEPAELREQLLRQAIAESIGAGGVLLLPIFALERTQEVLYELSHLVETRQLPPIPVFLDSPLSIDALNVYRQYSNLFDDQAKARLALGDDLFRFPGLTLTRSVEESKTINNVKPPKLILAGSGMITGGRMIHHLKRYLDGADNTLLIISYQAEGTIGRALLDGAKEISLDGEKIPVRANIRAIGAYSSHADQPKLLHFAKELNSPAPQKVFINHGEAKSALMLADGLKQKLNLNVTIAEYGQNYEI